MRRMILAALVGLVAAWASPLLLLAEAPTAGSPRVSVATDTNGVLFSATNLFRANSNNLNASVGGLNTNLVGVAVTNGTATLAYGTNRVLTTAAYTTNRVGLSYKSLDGTISTLGYKTVTDGVGFTIISGNNADTNKVDWWIMKP